MKVLHIGDGGAGPDWTNPTEIPDHDDASKGYRFVLRGAIASRFIVEIQPPLSALGHLQTSQTCR